MPEYVPGPVPLGIWLNAIRFHVPGATGKNFITVDLVLTLKIHELLGGICNPSTVFKSLPYGDYYYPVAVSSITWQGPASLSDFQSLSYYAIDGTTGQITDYINPQWITWKNPPTMLRTFTFAPWTYVARSVGGFPGGGPGEWFMSGARGKSKTTGNSNFTNGQHGITFNSRYGGVFKTGTGSTVLAHGDSYSSGPTCATSDPFLGGVGQTSAHGSGVYIPPGTLFPSSPLVSTWYTLSSNYGQEYASLPLDFSGTTVELRATPQSKPTKYKVVATADDGSTNGYLGYPSTQPPLVAASDVQGANFVGWSTDFYTNQYGVVYVSVLFQSIS